MEDVIDLFGSVHDREPCYMPMEHAYNCGDVSFNQDDYRSGCTFPHMDYHKVQATRRLRYLFSGGSV